MAGHLTRVLLGKNGFSRWFGIDREQGPYQDAAKAVSIRGHAGGLAKMGPQVEVPSIGFFVEIRSTGYFSAAFAIIGNETNGRYYG